MKSKYELPFSIPQTLCDYYIAFPCAILEGNSGENFPLLLCRKYINCWFEESGSTVNFELALSDHWWGSEKIILDQMIRLSKETWESRQMDVVQTIKQCLLLDIYVGGLLDGSCIETANGNGVEMVNYMITGYGDDHQTFLVKCLDSQMKFHCCEVNYQAFSNVLYALPKRNIELDLWKYNKDADISLNLSKLISETEEYVASCSAKSQQAKGKVYGLQAIRSLLHHFQVEANCNRPINVRFLRKYATHKRFMKERLLYLASKGFVPWTLLEKAESVNQMGEEVLRLGLKYNESLDGKLPIKMVEQMEKSLEIEREYVLEFLKSLYLIKN